MSVMPEVVRLLTTHHGTAPLPSSVVLFVRLGGAVAGVPPEETAFGHLSFFRGLSLRWGSSEIQEQMRQIVTGLNGRRVADRLFLQPCTSTSLMRRDR